MLHDDHVLVIRFQLQFLFKQVLEDPGRGTVLYPCFSPLEHSEPCQLLHYVSVWIDLQVPGQFRFYRINDIICQEAVGEITVSHFSGEFNLV